MQTAKLSSTTTTVNTEEIKDFLTIKLTYEYGNEILWQHNNKWCILKLCAMSITTRLLKMKNT